MLFSLLLLMSQAHSVNLTITGRQAELRDVTLVLNSNLVNLLSTEQAPAYLTPDFIYSNNTVV